MAKENEIITKIFLNDKDAQDKLKKLEATLEDIRRRRDAAYSAGNESEYKKLNAVLKNTRIEMDEIKVSGDLINHTLSNLSTASVKELRRNIAIINNELKSGRVKRGSEDWKVLNTQLRKCKEELQKINMESKSAVDGRSSFSKIADFFNSHCPWISTRTSGSLAASTVSTSQKRPLNTDAALSLTMKWCSRALPGCHRLPRPLSSCSFSEAGQNSTSSLKSRELTSTRWTWALILQNWYGWTIRAIALNLQRLLIISRIFRRTMRQLVY